MKIACVGYRPWALNIYHRLEQETDHVFLKINGLAQFDEELIKDFKPDLVLFYGWSWKIPPSLINSLTCLMLHPSPLPKYRGGSPVQNQIIAGETQSAVSVFIMTNEMDAGDLLGQLPLSLSGSLDQIFADIEAAGFIITLKILQQGLLPQAQNHADATYCKRLTPAESEITLQDLQGKTASYLYNKIRMLADPYPNAFIRTSDGKKLLIKVAEVAENESRINIKTSYC
jgi:methionyl-tRNA formyltransferase